MLKFLPGIVLVQIITVGLVLIFPVDPVQSAIWSWLRLAAPVLVVGLLTACWFGAVAAHLRKDAISRLQEDHAREREAIRMQAERAKAKVLQQAHKETLQAVQRTSTRATLKVGAAFAGLAAIGGALLLTQFMTLGLLTLTTVRAGPWAATCCACARRRTAPPPCARARPTCPRPSNPPPRRWPCRKKKGSTRAQRQPA